VTADPAELRGERARGAEHRLAQPCRQRHVLVVDGRRGAGSGSRGAVGGCPFGAPAGRHDAAAELLLRRVDHGFVRRSIPQRSIVDQLAHLGRGGILVERGEHEDLGEQLRPARRRRLVAPGRAPAVVAELASPRTVDLGKGAGAEAGSDGRDGRPEVGAPGIAFVLDQAVEHRVHRCEGRDLARAHGRLAGRVTRGGHPRRDSPRSPRVRRIEGALAADDRLEAMLPSRRARERDCPHRAKDGRPGAVGPRKRSAAECGQARASSGFVAPAGVGRPAAMCSTFWRSSSRPAGSNS
jgi:hypothetical protein